MEISDIVGAEIYFQNIPPWGRDVSLLNKLDPQIHGGSIMAMVSSLNTLTYKLILNPSNAGTTTIFSFDEFNSFSSQ